jgi:hypothetical protein
VGKGRIDRDEESVSKAGRGKKEVILGEKQESWRGRGIKERGKEDRKMWNEKGKNSWKKEEEWENKGQLYNGAPKRIVLNKGNELSLW